MFLSEISNFNDNKDMTYLSKFRFRKSSLFIPVEKKMCHISKSDIKIIRGIFWISTTKNWNYVFNPGKPKSLRFINGSYYGYDYGYDYEEEVNDDYYEDCDCEDYEDYNQW